MSWILFLFSTTEGLAAITSRAAGDVQGRGGNIGRLSDDHSIIAIFREAGPAASLARERHAAQGIYSANTYVVM
ncbi:hypothetical protein TU82_10495 [Pseudomonas orientalis]|nr:hypothetical protein TU82_10495 [Pseudomonas orientalis]